VLEDASHKITLQKWDFRPSANFLAEMQKAAGAADQTTAVLSPNYLKSSFATPEWAAAMSQDPMGAKFKLVPVRVEKFDPMGIWRALIYIDLVGVDEETAKRRLIDGLSTGRAKPFKAPLFPGATHAPHAGASFPGGTKDPTSNKAPSTYLPRINRVPSDLDQRRFAQQGFARIKKYFEQAVMEFKDRDADIDADLTAVSAVEFIAEIFVAGTSRCRCKVWLGGMFNGNEISYAEGSSIRGNAVNESLSVVVDDGDIAFRSLMGGSLGKLPRILTQTV
jgi:hypothetical protein